MKRWLKVLVISCVLMLLSGCYDLNVKYHRDGSGQLTYIIPQDETIDIQEFKKNLVEINKKAGKEVVEFLRSTKTEKSIRLSVSFNKISYLFEDKALFYGPFSEFVKENPDRIKSVRDLKGNLIPVNLTDENLFIAFHSAGYIDKATIEVPGRILYVSDKSQLMKSNTAIISNSFGFVIFKQHNYYLWITSAILLLIMILIPFYMIRKRAKIAHVNNNHEE